MRERLNGVGGLGLWEIAGVVSLCAASLGLGVSAATAGSSCAGYCNNTAGLGGMALSFVLVAVVSSLVVWVFRRRHGRSAPLRSALFIGAVSVCAAMPMEVGWDDGCNSHGGTMALGAGVVTAMTTPETSPLAFDEIQTLIDCRPSRRG